MGENFTGVKNQKLTRLAVGLAAVVVVVAAELALVQPRELTAQLAGKGARPAVFMVTPMCCTAANTYRDRCMPDRDRARLVGPC